MRSLEGDYKDRLRLEVIAGSSARAQEVKQYGIGNHGLVGLTPDGQVKLKLPGHGLGKKKDVPEIRQAIEQELKSKLLN